MLDDTMLSSSMHKLVKHISTFIVFISSMSLIVSGLSILNNSYANIAMRSPEIALRRVLGASQKKDSESVYCGIDFIVADRCDYRWSGGKTGCYRVSDV